LAEITLSWNVHKKLKHPPNLFHILEKKFLDTLVPKKSCSYYLLKSAAGCKGNVGPFMFTVCAKWRGHKISPKPATVTSKL